MISEGRSINVTLIFSLERYAEVIEAYLVRARGLRRATSRRWRAWRRSSSAGSTPRSTAGSTRSARPRRSPCGARPRWPTRKLAYELFRERFPAPGGTRSAPEGATRAAAAVGVDVDEEPGLSRHAVRRSADRAGHGQHHARRDDRSVRRPRHGRPHGRRRRRPSPARLGALAGVGIDIDDVARVLEDEGVASFAKSFDELLTTLQAKADEIAAQG